MSDPLTLEKCLPNISGKRGGESYAKQLENYYTKKYNKNVSPIAVLKNRIRKRLLDAFSFIPKKRTRIFIDHKKGCHCQKCIQKWIEEDIYFGRNEDYELSLPEGYSILFIDKDRMETSKIDV